MFQQSVVPEVPEVAKLPQQPSTSKSCENVTDLAAITVSTRIPEFWTDMPRLWFAQVESILAPQKQGDESKFNLVIAKMGRDVLQQVSDILLNPPETNKYQALKDRLLLVYEESAERQFQKLVGEMELGTQKPSQLLRRMQELGRNAQTSEHYYHKKTYYTRLQLLELPVYSANLNSGRQVHA